MCGKAVAGAGNTRARCCCVDRPLGWTCGRAAWAAESSRCRRTGCWQADQARGQLLLQAAVDSEPACSQQLSALWFADVFYDHFVSDKPRQQGTGGGVVLVYAQDIDATVQAMEAQAVGC